MAAAFKPTFGRLNGTVGASGATDHDALLEASELMPVGAEQVFEKVHSIPAHDRKSLFAVTIGLPRTEGFDLAQNRAHFARANRGNNSHGPQRLDCRGIGRLLCRARPQRPAARLYLAVAMVGSEWAILLSRRAVMRVKFKCSKRSLLCPGVGG